MTFPLLRPGGRLLALKGERAAEEVEPRPSARADGRPHAEVPTRSATVSDRTYVVAVGTGPAKALR